MPVDLTVREYDLLAFFALHPHQLFSRSQLLELVWHSDTKWQQEATVTEHVYRVRAKITRPGERNAIVTIRGGGYRYDPPGPRSDDAVSGDEVGRKRSPAAELDEICRSRGEYVIVTALRALLRIGSAEDAAALLQLSVRQLGGTVIAAKGASRDALSIDVALDVGAPMLAVAAPNSVARLLLERFLPQLTEDARYAVNLLRRLPTEEESTGAPITGPTTRRGLHSVVTAAGDEANAVIDLHRFKKVDVTVGRDG